MARVGRLRGSRRAGEVVLFSVVIFFGVALWSGGAARANCPVNDPNCMGSGGGGTPTTQAQTNASAPRITPPSNEDENPPTTQFRMRVTSGVSVSGVILGGGVLNVEVQAVRPDGPYGPKQKLTWVGGGLSIGLQAGLSGQSEWADVQTPRATTADNFGGMGGVASYPSANFFNQGGGLGSHVNIGGPKGTGNQYVNPDGAGLGINLISIEGGYWFQRGKGR